MASKTIIVTGGAGYIGSAIVLKLLEHNYHVIVVDRKEQDSWSACTAIQEKVTYIQSDYSDRIKLSSLFKNYTIQAVIHCAASIEIGHSMKDPSLFYENNVAKTLTLLNAMHQFGCQTIIFSSSSAVYGIKNSKKYLLKETDTRNPINTYGKTKYIVELLLEDYARAYGFNAIALRYFNACGALPIYNIGEQHTPETHIIPLAFKAAYTHSTFTIFGTSYNTPDGTCVRDYLHIYDIAQAHIQALSYSKHNLGFHDFNIATGIGFSVKEIISGIEAITQKNIILASAPVRLGDPAYLIGQNNKAHKELNWSPTYSTLKQILTDAHAFHSKTSSL